MKRRIDDKEVIELLDKMFMGEQMSLEERSKLHVAVSNQYRKTRLKRFFDESYSLFLFTAMFICVGVVMAVSGKVGDLLPVTFNVLTVMLPVICFTTARLTLDKVSVWMENLIIFSSSIEEITEVNKKDE